MDKEFKNLNLKNDLLSNLKELGFLTMTPIQEKALPFVLDGKDVLGKAETGSGKTAVFGLGILNSLDLSLLSCQGFILCPTRELAEQVALEIRKFARFLKNVKVLTICGGVAEIHQDRSLEYGAHIIVGTPGRVLKLLKKGSLKLQGVTTLTLDEADRMLDMGFINDINEIISFLPKVRQTMLFSATFPESIIKLSKTVQKEDAIMVEAESSNVPDTIEEHFFEVETHQDKEAALIKVLGNFKPERFIVFCKTKQIVEDVADFLHKKKIHVNSLHGDMMQNERTLVLTEFSNRSLSGLISTDVAARGLDIEDLDAVFNFDIPTDPKVYIHRIGRTGRAGKKGAAFSFFVPKGRYALDNIETLTKKKCPVQKLSDLKIDEQYGLIPTMSTMYVGGGKKDKLRPGDLLGALVKEASLEASDVGNIAILNIISYVAIKRDKIDEAVKKLSSGKIKNKKFKVGRP